MSYKALPDALHIGDSQVAGQGIFAKEDIPADTELGLSHILLEECEDPIFSVSYVKEEIFRTPLGGFINHSDTPNCIKVRGVLGREDVEDYDKYFLYTERPIKAWEELTVKYTFYNVKNELGTK